MPPDARPRRTPPAVGCPQLQEANTTKHAVRRLSCPRDACDASIRALPKETSTPVSPQIPTHERTPAFRAPRAIFPGHASSPCFASPSSPLQPSPGPRPRPWDRRPSERNTQMALRHGRWRALFQASGASHARRRLRLCVFFCVAPFLLSLSFFPFLSPGTWQDPHLIIATRMHPSRPGGRVSCPVRTASSQPHCFPDATHRIPVARPLASRLHSLSLPAIQHR